MTDERTPEEKEADRLLGIELCKKKAQTKANKRRAAFVVIDRGEQQEPFPEGRHRFICRSFRLLEETMQPHWNIVIVVGPKGQTRPRKPRPSKRVRKARRAAREAALQTRNGGV